MEAMTPTVVFTFFGVSVTSTVVATWFAMGIIILTVVLLSKFKPTILQIYTEFVSDLISSIMNTEDVHKFLPFLGTLMAFIAFANSIGIFPVFSSPTSNLNTTIALSIVVFFAVHSFGIQSKGFFGYLKDLASPIFMLPLEIISQISRTLSLSLRLFGNMLSGDLIVSIILNLVPLLAPLPMMGLSLLIGLLQAYVFTALSAVYISSAVENPG